MAYVNTETVRITDGQGKVLDEQTKETLTSSKKTSRKEDGFITLYFKHVGKLYELTKIQLGIILCAAAHGDLRFASDNDAPMGIVFHKYLKERIVQDLNTSMQTINNNLTIMTKRNFLKRINTDYYQLNPHIFGYGLTKDVKAIRKTYEFTEDGEKEYMSYEYGDNDDNYDWDDDPETIAYFSNLEDKAI